ncbi:MAG TPA: hypothetical protein VFS39_19075 [Nitrospira sp.]|nr:hypothetical protein [Nitrospira sp.]
MNALTQGPCLPFPRLQRTPEERQSHGPSDEICLVSLRQLRIPLRSHDRLILLYGHPVLFRLGLHAAMERTLDGEHVVYLDGANTFDAFLIGRLARAKRQEPRKLLSLIHVARAYTNRQMDRLLSDCLGEALERYGARVALLSGLFETIYGRISEDKAAPQHFGRMLDALLRLKRQAVNLVCLCPLPSLIPPASRSCFEQLRTQADRIVAVSEEQGIVTCCEEGAAPRQSWRVTTEVVYGGETKSDGRRRRPLKGEDRPLPLHRCVASPDREVDEAPVTPHA